jgi:peptidoglycan/LPS O-acetylase OafA/YrhL
MNCGKNLNQSILHQGGSRTEPIGYMPGLDGLRALAVFAVIAYHLNLTWAPGGLLGVSLFFVLSGYLITDILLTQWERSGSIDLRDFWLRRARRLLPALFAMLAGVMSWVAIFTPERLAALKQEMLAAVCYVGNWYLIFHDVSYFERFGPPSPLGHLWSLAIEEQFYLLWPLLLGLALRFLPRRKWIIGGTAAVALLSAAAMALIYIPGHDPSRVYYGTDTRAFALLAGAVLAMIWPSRRMSADLSGKKRLALDAAGGMGLLAVIVMIAKTNQYQTFLYQGGLLLFSAAAACVIAALAHPAGRLGRIFGWRPFRWLGKCSYGIYLWHYPVIVLTSPAVNTEGPDLMRAFWQIAASVILAALSLRLVEEPIRYGRRKRSRDRAPGLRRRWRSAFGARISVSILLTLIILFTASVQGVQISAENSEPGHVPGKQSQDTEAQASDEQAQAPDEQTQASDEPAQATETQAPEPEKASQGDEEPGQAIQEQDMTAEERDQTPTGEKNGNSRGDIVNSNEDPAANGKSDETNRTAEIKGDEITAIGDSLMLDAKPVLQERLPGIFIDSKIGRQMHEAPELISRLREEGNLGQTVILELGTNGSFTEKQLAETLDSLQEVQKIVLVNTRVPRPWETAVNETLAKVSASYPNTTLIDWYSASSGHDDYFYPDGVHLNRTGADAYCDIMIKALVPDGNGEE